MKKAEKNFCSRGKGAYRKRIFLAICLFVLSLGSAYGAQSTPETGGSNQLILWLSVMTVALLGIIIVTVVSKKRK